ncbi:phosphoglycolate phosphatase [Oceanibacterium hippocampi]|uniref:Phosphoglycolate phosphatase n=1 Tax=Oceanibacterium hippocampi TaxID=745714 RepID=A0A1Y5T958_9PROT|nr:phosphoglycolate phosphatase [Oceanibacterium hippocampi]SLN56665.1 Phosphoglycolate phosphatase [Oceanibacterium hippocampi]
MQRLAIIFDLDGTLVDTAPDLHGALQAALAHVGRPGIPLERVKHLVGAGARALVERGLDETGGRDDDALVETAFAAFLAHYGENLSVASRPYPGMVAALDALEARGARFAVCTNKPEVYSRRLLDELGLSHRFRALLGGDSLPVRKPDPAHILTTMERFGAQPHEAVMIGDTATDVNAARAAGIPVVAVRFGYSQVPIESLGADAVIDRFDELDGLLARLP